MTSHSEPVSPPAHLAGLLIISGAGWNAGQFTFSIPGAGSTFAYGGEATASGFRTLTPEQAARFSAAIAAWDGLIAPDFTQTDDATAPGSIRVAFTNYTAMGGAWGYAYVAANDATSHMAQPGDIWVNNQYASATFEAGSFNFAAFLHEIGHALGLTHPHDVPRFDEAYDLTVYTVMSYHDANHIHRTFGLNGGVLRAFTSEVYASTPMVLDIAAIQSRYGADPDTAVGDTVYTFDEDRPFVMAIYDAGGIDTIDLSTHTRGSVINLTPGAYSDIAAFSVADQIAASIGRFGASQADFITAWLSQPDTYSWTNNLGIAYSTVIENAKGGAGNDRITGNAADNRLEGGAGNDVLLGAAGDDFLVGGAGDDILCGGDGYDVATFAFNLADGGVAAYGPGLFVGGEGIDWTFQVERYVFLDGVVEQADGNPFVDDLFYYGTNKDVWAARADADTHYLTSGWKEGRDPNAWFDTKGYLAAYADARQAAAQGMDPLTHYLTVGWKKGHDPSLQFDGAKYLAFYADVAAANMSPLEHFLRFGRDEGRHSFSDPFFN